MATESCVEIVPSHSLASHVRKYRLFLHQLRSPVAGALLKLDEKAQFCRKLSENTLHTSRRMTAQAATWGRSLRGTHLKGYDRSSRPRKLSGHMEMDRSSVQSLVLNSYTTIADTTVPSSDATQSKARRMACFCPLTYLSDMRSFTETSGVEVVVTGAFAKKPISLHHVTRRYL